MKMVLGIDPGTIRTGWCVLNGREPVDWGIISFSTSKHDAWERLRLTYFALKDRIELFEPDIVAAEEPFPIMLHKNPETDRKIMCAFAAAMYAAYECKREFVSVHPMQVRHSGFHKRAPDHAIEFLGWEGKDKITVAKKKLADLWDAVGVATHVAGFTYDEWKAERWQLEMFGEER